MGASNKGQVVWVRGTEQLGGLTAAVAAAGSLGGTVAVVWTESTANWMTARVSLSLSKLQLSHHGWL